MTIFFLSGTFTAEICENASEHYARKVHFFYRSTEKINGHCNCTITGADNVTIHTYRAAAHGSYCLSILYVNNRAYACSDDNWPSEDYKNIIETLPSDRATTMTLNINNLSYQPILELEFKSKYKIQKQIP